MTQVTEGKVTIVYNEKVFYNRSHQFNRDLSVAIIAAWKHQESHTLFEAHSATGIAGLRYLVEVGGLKMVCNDTNPSAVACVQRNATLNNVNVTVTTGCAALELYKIAGGCTRYDIIDLDPYGSSSPFFEAAIMAIKDGGLLCLKCTDMQVLAGCKTTETCFNKYGGLPLKGVSCHEMALRLVLGGLASVAARHKSSIVPLVSLSADFYVRLYVVVVRSPEEAKSTASKLSHVYQCMMCESFILQPLGKTNQGKFGWTIHNVPVQCPECEGRYHVAGPIWNAPIHSKEFLELVLQKAEVMELDTKKRILGILNVMKEELDVPLFHTLGSLCGILHCDSISLKDIGSALLNANYEFSISHINGTAIKTNAPNSALWDILRAHARRSKVKEQKPGTTAHKLLNNAKDGSTVNANFEFHPGSTLKSSKMARFMKVTGNAPMSKPTAY